MGDYDPDKEYQEIENKIDKPLISCTKMSKYFWFPFITPVFITIRDIMFNKTINENDEINFNLVYMISISTFLFLAGIIYFIIDFRVFIDRQRTKSILKKDPKRHIKQTNKLEITFILLLMSVSFAVYIFSVPLSVKYIVLEKRQYTLFLIVFLSKFLLKKKIARHQKLSLCVAFCGFILLSISKINKMTGNDIWVNGVSFIGTVFYAIHYVYLEFLNKRDDFEIYFCYMTVGIFSIISSFIGFIIYSLYFYKNLSTLEDGLYFFKNAIASEYYFYLSIFVVAGVATELFVAFTIYYCSLTHFVLSSHISPLLLYIHKIIFSKKEKDKDSLFFMILNFIGFIIELFAILFYNEIIVVNACGLNKETIKGINDREKEEHLMMETNEENIKKNIKEKNCLEIEGGYNLDLSEDYGDNIEMEKFN